MSADAYAESVPVEGERRQVIIPKPGQIVGVRQRLYLTEQVIEPVDVGDSTLVKLSCVDDDAQGQPLEVLWEQELDARIVSDEAWDTLATRGFDPGERFAAYLNTLRWNCVTSTDPKLLQSPFRAGIRLSSANFTDAAQQRNIEVGLLLRSMNVASRLTEFFDYLVGANQLRRAI